MNLPLPNWKNKLQGIPAFIVANGPSLSGVDLSALNNRFTIGINRAFLALDPTILLWQDAGLLSEHAKDVRKLKAFKVCRHYADLGYRLADLRFDPQALGVPREASASSGVVGAALAALLGCRPIVLLGVDCCYREGKTNFYGTNGNHHAHTLPNCLAALEWLRAQAFDLLNCSANGVISPRVTIAEALAAVGDRGIGTRETFVERLRINR